MQVEEKIYNIDDYQANMPAVVQVSKGQTVIATDKNNIKTYVVGDCAEITKVNETVFSLVDKSKNNRTYTIPAIDIKSEKVFAKLVAINDDSIVIQLNLPKGELLRELPAYFKKALEKQDLLVIGAEFYFVTVEKEAGIEIVFEPYYRDYKPEVEDMYDFLMEDSN